MKSSWSDYRKYVEKHYGNFDSFSWWNDQCLNNRPLIGKQILDIGCGDGIRSTYLALKYQPQELLAIDNYAGDGSHCEGERFFRDLVSHLDATNIKIIKADIKTLSNKEETYDVVTCLQVAHHLFETTTSIMKDADLLESSQNFFSKIHSLLKPNGCFILEEVSNRCIFRYLKAHMKNIEWETKRSSKEWVYVLEKAGFSQIECKYYVPYKLRTMQGLLNNSVANFFLGSKYFIYACK